MSKEADMGLPPNESRAPMLLGVTWTMVSLASIAVILRVYCRTILQNAVGWDDYAILIAMVGGMSFS